MTSSTWEDMISLNSYADVSSQIIGSAATYAAEDQGSVEWDRERFPLERALALDNSPLPSTEQREGYYGNDHFAYWASGMRDYCQLLEWIESHEVATQTILDIGCATGRLIRHAQANNEFDEVIGCDINRAHVDWITRHLDTKIKVFQNTSIPSLQLPDASIDVVTAFSVFTHVECFDTTWLMELRRILRPGGIAWLTIHNQRTWQEMKPTWPIYAALNAHPDFADKKNNKELPSDRTVFRWHSERSYSANVFYRDEYIRRVWGRILTYVDSFPALPPFQQLVVLRKE
ncbi:hypothetical protein AWB67_00398 [Caballeronia terrestris]|uniref:Methyltransferase type 12 domain-containing protein n=1 Tax=Caballeronia terrestris TaxID=1226301 RepID=A0A158F8F4_9BURK|nr:class I SAM-dependent methyltransferase [Caballeronia terrestris]SAL16146.1 hypothetical protein AWB67_00398 [Caballeronia terrestris]